MALKILIDFGVITLYFCSICMELRDDDPKYLDNLFSFRKMRIIVVDKQATKNPE